MLFADRPDAGRILGAHIAAMKVTCDCFLGLPRGGVPVAAEIARMFAAQLDVFVVRKLGVPGQEELAFGAVASGGVRVLNQDVVNSLDISDAQVAAIAARELREVQRREAYYREGLPPALWHGRRLTLVDDGLATGASMHAAVLALRKHQPKTIAVAVPVAPQDTLERLRGIADAVFCVATPMPFRGVGAWYDDFAQVDDDTVRDLLRVAAER